MKKIIILFIAFAFTNINIAQEKIKGNKNVTVTKTSLDSFTKIKISNDFKVVLLKSNTSSIEIETDENLHSYINFNIVNSTLEISTDKNLKPKRLYITVSYETPLEAIILEKDSEIEALNTLNSQNFILTINDYSKADLTVISDNFTLRNNNRSKFQINSKSKLDIESKNANIELKESSNSEITIRTDSLQVVMKENSFANISGYAVFSQSTVINSSKFKGKNLVANECYSVIKNNADFIIQCTNTIKIEASEKSNIELYGNPEILLVKFEGQSKLSKKEL